MVGKQFGQGAEGLRTTILATASIVSRAGDGNVAEDGAVTDGAVALAAQSATAAGADGLRDAERFGLGLDDLLLQGFEQRFGFGD